MADYNTFVVVDCKARKPILVTSSARKAWHALCFGFRVEVWNGNELCRTIYAREAKPGYEPMKPYLVDERQYVKDRQAKAEARNRKRRFYDT